MSAQPWEQRVAHLEGAYEQVDRRLGTIDARLETADSKADTRFDALDRKVDAFRDEVGRRFDEVGRRIDAYQWRTTALIVTTWISAMLVTFFHRG